MDNFFPFDENSEVNRTIYRRMRFWERLVVRFFGIFRKEFLPDYFSNIGIRQLEHDLLISNTGWYNPSTKELTVQFAQDLHEFLKSLAVIASILKETTGSPALREKAQGAKIPLIEQIFCDLRGGGRPYPFTEKEIFKLVNNVPIRNMEKIVRTALSTHISSLSEEEIDEINARYTRFAVLDRALSVSTMDFLRRFNINASLVDTCPWDPLTIGASAYYLDNLYNSLSAVIIKAEDLPYISALHKTQKAFNPEAESRSDEELSAAWGNIDVYITLSREDIGLPALLRLAHHSLEYLPENNPPYYNFVEKYQAALEERLKALIQNITRNSLKHEMKQLGQDILPSSIYSADLTDVGIFTAANSDRIQAIIDENLRNVYAMSLLQVFLIKFYKPWVKKFLGSCSVTAQFSQNNVRAQVSGIYRSFNKLTDAFDKFAQDVQPKSSMGQRITKLLDNTKMNRSDKHLLKVFTDSLNGQADLLIKEFYKHFPGLFWFTSRLSKDLANGTSEFVSNILSVKALQDQELPARLDELISFSTNVIDLLNISPSEEKSSPNSLESKEN